MGGVVRRFQRAASRDKYGHLKFQERKILNAYSFIQTTLTRRSLICTGVFHPFEYADNYLVRIVYEPFQHPKVYIEKPPILVDSKIHMYPDGSLCLYHPIDFEWNMQRTIAEHIIPRINEWIVYYEDWKYGDGIWAGPEIEH